MAVVGSQQEDRLRKPIFVEGKYEPFLHDGRRSQNRAVTESHVARDAASGVAR